MFDSVPEIIKICLISSQYRRSDSIVVSFLVSNHQAFFNYGCLTPQKIVLEYTFLYSKLMRSNQPQVKIHFKWDSNRLVIDFFDPIPAVQSTCRGDLIQIWTIYIKNSLIYIKNWLNLAENG